MVAGLWLGRDSVHCQMPRKTRLWEARKQALGPCKTGNDGVGETAADKKETEKQPVQPFWWIATEPHSHSRDNGMKGGGGLVVGVQITLQALVAVCASSA